jgi:hypothetical protein
MAQSIKSPTPIEKPAKVDGCPHYSGGRCRILGEDVDKLNADAEKYDDSAESEADDDL